LPGKVPIQQVVILPTDDFGRLVEAAHAGQEWAVAALYDGLQPALLRYLRSQEARAADDLASDTWVAVARGIGRFEGDASAFRAWVFSIARRRLADYRRTGARRRTQPVAAPTLARLPSGQDPADVVTSQITAQEAIDRLKSLLPSDQAEIVVLRVVGGLGVEDVARILGKRPGTVRVLQHRALRRLSVQLDREFLLEA
jgi:RNA polymerase sigma-70 factor (ECF subfamily)